jgi:hypothetical protein
LETKKEKGKTYIDNSFFSFIRKLFKNSEEVEIYNHEKDPTIEEYIHLNNLRKYSHNLIVNILRPMKKLRRHQMKQLMQRKK